MARFEQDVKNVSITERPILGRAALELGATPCLKNRARRSVLKNGVEA
jgi:hypothetical protein